MEHCAGHNVKPLIFFDHQEELHRWKKISCLKWFAKSPGTSSKAPYCLSNWHHKDHFCRQTRNMTDALLKVLLAFAFQVFVEAIYKMTIAKQSFAVNMYLNVNIVLKWKCRCITTIYPWGNLFLTWHWHHKLKLLIDLNIYFKAVM